MFDFSGKVAIVTGASGNLGQAVARAFLASGAKLALFDHHKDQLESHFADFGSRPMDLLPVEADLTNEESTQAAVERAADHFGRIDILVNTVGGFRGGTPLHKTPIETWDFLIGLNASTVFFACRAVIPHLIQGGSGKIVNVAARAALSGSANMAAYTAAKSAVLRLTEAMAAELKGKGINVNCILPGTLDTPQNRQDRPGEDYSRWVTPDALAEVILFLCSDAARAVHGALIPVYGLS
jgi:NAD(P)-dependent dehydrogenase (short-subunit alcohol dehydrogenase family)